MDARKIIPIVGDEARQRQVDFTDQHPIGIVLSDLPHLGDDLSDLRLVGGIDLQKAIDVRLTRSKGWIDRVIPKGCVLHQVPQHIDAKPVDTEIEPEAHHRIHGGAHIGIAPIEIGLFRQKGMVIVLFGRWVPCPGAAAKIAHPIVRRSAGWSAISPDVPVALEAGARAAAVYEPGMVIGGVIGHKIHNDLEPAPMGLT